MLVAFVVALGFAKGVMNFVAGRLAERIGRKWVLLIGWPVALLIPPLVHFATSWDWIVFATILRAVNHGLTWSITQTVKLDISRADQRGVVIGLNELSGYLGVAVACYRTGVVLRHVFIKPVLVHSIAHPQRFWPDWTRLPDAGLSLYATRRFE